MSGYGCFRADKFVECLDPIRITPSHGGRPMIFINGKRLTETELRALRRWKADKSGTVRMGTVDAWATRFDLPLWEIEEKASRLLAA